MVEAIAQFVFELAAAIADFVFGLVADVAALIIGLVVSLFSSSRRKRSNAEDTGRAGAAHAESNEDRRAD